MNFDASAETARVYMRISEYWESHVLPALEEDEGLTIAKAREIIRRPTQVIENGAIRHAEPHAELSRRMLAAAFKRWLVEIPEEGVICLHEHWMEVMVVFEDRVWEEMHKYAVFEPPTPAYKRRAAVNADGMPER